MKSEKDEFRNTVEFLTRNFWLNPATRSVELTPEGWVYFGEITQDISTELYNDPKKVNELAGRGSVILIESSLMGQVFESNSETKNLDHIDDTNNLIKVPSSLNVDLIDEVIDQGDLISVKLKNGKQLLYNKTDIPVDELKRLEELKLLKGTSKTLKNLNGLDDFLNDPSKLKNVKPDELFNYLKNNGYNPQPLSGGSFKGVSFEDGGGFEY